MATTYRYWIKGGDGETVSGQITIENGDDHGRMYKDLLNALRFIRDTSAAQIVIQAGDFPPYIFK